MNYSEISPKENIVNCLITLFSNINNITQNKGKENGNSYQKLKRSRWTDIRKHTVTKLKYFNGHGRLSQSEEGECM